jgi:hypothetical protein
MSKSAPQAPPPPNPALVAQQQTGSNIDTAVTQKALNNTNQYTPFGSTTYQQTGSQSIGGVDVPTYSQTTSFNPAVQSIITGTENAGASLVPAVQTLTDQAGKSAMVGMNSYNGRATAQGPYFCPNTSYGGPTGTNPPVSGLNGTFADGISNVWLMLESSTIGVWSGGAGCAGFCLGWRDNI